MKYAILAAVLLGFAGCGDGVTMTSKRSQKALKILQGQCDGKVIYKMNYHHVLFTNDVIIHYNSYQCIPDGIRIVR